MIFFLYIKNIEKYKNFIHGLEQKLENEQKNIRLDNLFVFHLYSFGF